MRKARDALAHGNVIGALLQGEARLTQHLDDLQGQRGRSREAGRFDPCEHQQAGALGRAGNVEIAGAAGGAQARKGPDDLAGIQARHQPEGAGEHLV